MPSCVDYVYLAVGGTQISAALVRVYKYSIATLLFCGGSFLMLVAMCSRPFWANWSHVFGRAVSRPLLRVIGIKVEVEGNNSNLPCPCVLVGNHQHTIDLLTFGSVLPERCISIGKKAILFVPFFGLAYWLSGQILVDRKKQKSAMASLEKASRVLINDQVRILIFPEGTRSKGKGLLRFKRGAFHLAIGAGVPIVPFTISDYANIDLGKFDSGTVRIKFLEPIETCSMERDSAKELAEKCRQLILNELQSLKP